MVTYGGMSRLPVEVSTVSFILIAQKVAHMTGYVIARMWLKIDSLLHGSIQSSPGSIFHIPYSLFFVNRGESLGMRGAYTVSFMMQ